MWGRNPPIGVTSVVALSQFSFFRPLIYHGLRFVHLPFGWRLGRSWRHNGFQRPSLRLGPDVGIPGKHPSTDVAGQESSSIVRRGEPLQLFEPVQDA